MGQLTYTTLQVQDILDNSASLSQSIFINPLTGKVSYMDFDDSGDVIAHEEGRLYYDANQQTHVALNDIPDVALNLGEELWARIENTTGSVLPNGIAVYVKGSINGKLDVELADASSFEASVRTIGLMTNETIAGEDGYVVRFGVVRDIDTSLCTIGDILFVDPENPGMVTNIRPKAPDYVVRIGLCLAVDAVNGAIAVDTIPFSGTDTTNNLDGILNGIVPQAQAISFVVDTGVVYADVINSLYPTKELPVLFGDVRYNLDTLTGSGVAGAARVALTPGANSNTPQVNYVYIQLTAGVPVLTSSISLPTDPASAVLGTVSLYDVATTLADNSVLAYRRFNNAMHTEANDGFINELALRIRALGSQWESGIEPIISIGDADGVQLGSGLAWQLHLQNFTPTDGTKYYVVNHPDGVVEFDDFNDINIDAQGNVIPNNANVGYEICGAINSEGVLDRCLVILPTNYYASNSLTECIYDYNNYSVTTIGKDTGLADITFRVCRLVLKRNVAVWENPLIAETGDEYQDRRGQALGASSGGGGGGTTVVTNFSDANFSIYNDVDNTKIAKHDSSLITTATTNSYIYPAVGGTFMTTNGSDEYIAPNGELNIIGDLNSIGSTISTIQAGDVSYNGLVKITQGNVRLEANGTYDNYMSLGQTLTTFGKTLSYDSGVGSSFSGNQIPDVEWVNNQIAAVPASDLQGVLDAGSIAAITSNISIETVGYLNLSADSTMALTSVGAISVQSDDGITLEETSVGGGKVLITSANVNLSLGNFTAGLQASGFHVNHTSSAGYISLADNYWRMQGSYGGTTKSIIGNTAGVVLTNDTNIITLNGSNTTSSKKIDYTTDISGTFTGLSLINKDYADANYSGSINYQIFNGSNMSSNANAVMQLSKHCTVSTNPPPLPTTSQYDLLQNGALDPFLVPAGTINGMSFRCTACCSGDATALTTATARFDIYSTQFGSRTLLQTVRVPLDGTTAPGIYGDLGVSAHYHGSLEFITPITTSDCDLIGIEFVPENDTLGGRLYGIARVSAGFKLEF